jgi:putative lipoprotein
MKRLVVISLLAIGLLSLVACGGGSDQVTGTIVLPEGATVPEGATINVQIQDTSKADAPAEMIGQQTIEGSGQEGAISFAVDYNPDDIDSRFQYTMSVRVEDGQGGLLFINDTAIPVITNDNPTSGVTVPVIAVAG